MRLRCFAAGAAIVHNHVDVYMADGPTAAAAYLEGWQPVWEAIPGALLYPTVNGGPVEQSLWPLRCISQPPAAGSASSIPVRSTWATSSTPTPDPT